MDHICLQDHLDCLNVGESHYSGLQYHQGRTGRWKITKTKETDTEVDYSWEWEVESVEFTSLS